MKYILTAVIIFIVTTTNAQLVNGNVYKIKNAATGKYLKPGNTSGDADGIFQYPLMEDNAFKWTAVASGATYKLKNGRSNKFIAVTGAGTANGAFVIQYDDVNQADIKWTPVASGAGFKLRNSNSNKMLGVQGGSNATGARMVQWQDDGQADIVWIFEPATLSTTSEVRIPKRTWQSAMNLILLTMRLRINNYTPTAMQFNRDNTFKFTKPDDCQFKIGIAPNVVEQTFNLVPTRFNPATLYFNDINKRTATIESDGNKLKVTIAFEETGEEVLGNCIDNIICGGGMWWINLERPKVEIFMEPVIEAGKLTYRDNVKAKVTGVAKSVGMNVIVENLNNNTIFDQASVVFTSILNRPDIKNAFTNGLNANLGRLSLPLPNPLSSVRVDVATGDLIFR